MDCPSSSIDQEEPVRNEIGCASLYDQAGLRFEVQRAGSRPLSYMDELKRYPAAHNHGALPPGGPGVRMPYLFPCKAPCSPRQPLIPRLVPRNSFGPQPCIRVQETDGLLCVGLLNRGGVNDIAPMYTFKYWGQKIQKPVMVDALFLRTGLFAVRCKLDNPPHPLHLLRISLMYY